MEHLTQKKRFVIKKNKKINEKEIVKAEEKISNIFIISFPILSPDSGKYRSHDRPNDHSTIEHVKSRFPNTKFAFFKAT